MNRYRLRYYLGKFCAFLGLCRDCWTIITRLPRNKVCVCPNCRNKGCVHPNCRKRY